MHQLEKLKNIPGLVHGFSEIKDGNMSFDWGDENSVIKNRIVFLSGAGIDPKDCVITRTRMSHGTDIEKIGGTMKGRGMRAPVSGDADVDSFMTNEPGLFMAILTADCLPVILYSLDKKALALAHLSRVNTPLNFIGDIVRRMKSEYGVESADIVAGIGPCVHKESYVFGREEFEKRIPDERVFGGFISDIPGGKKAVDLVGYNVRQLILSGVKEANIEISSIDTAADKNFFSRCRSRLIGENEGRMATVVGMTA